VDSCEKEGGCEEGVADCSQKGSEKSWCQESACKPGVDGADCGAGGRWGWCSDLGLICCELRID
jgi:hypothetical protein